MSENISSFILQNAGDGLVKTVLESILPKALSFIISVILALLVYWIGIKIVGHVRKLIKKALNLRGTEVGVIQFTDALVWIIGYGVVIIAALRMFGVQSASVAAVVASIGVAASLALQGSLSNFAGGILILILKPFVVGDYIREDTHGNEGTVKEISIFYTKLSQIDGRIVVIPNGTLANSSLINMTSAGVRNLDMSFGISYEDDIRLAKELISNLVEVDDRIDKEREVSIFVRELADSAVVIGLRAWAPVDVYWKVLWDMNENVKYAFDEAGITIPYPQVTISRKR